MSKQKRLRKESKLLKYAKCPIRILARARDLYIRSLTGHVTFGNTMGCPTPQIPSLPKSFSTNSGYITSEEQILKEMMMIRSGSNRRKIEPELFRSRTAPVNRSNTAAFGRIDEDEEAFDIDEFVERGGRDDVVLLRGSRSYASAKRNKMA